MKKNDIAVLILIISISALIAYFIGKAVIGDPKNLTAEAEVVEMVSTNVNQPNPQVFNDNAINPTVKIEIGPPANQQPFNDN